MFVFEEYPPIEKKPRGVSLISNNGLANNDVVVTYKIHGANVAVYSDGAAVRVANRTRFLAEEDSFFGYRRALGEEEANRVRELVASLKQSCEPECSYAIVFAELFGPEVQDKVLYTPNVAFAVYDVAVVYLQKKTPLVKSTRFLDFDRVEELCRQCSLPVVPVIARFDSLSAALAQTDPNTLVNPYLQGQGTSSAKGTPPARSDPSVNEGVVVRLQKETVLVFDNPKTGQKVSKRCMFKWKSDVFEETAFAKNTPIGNYITGNRLDSVFSKLGPGVTAVQLATAFKEDVVADYLADHTNLHREHRKTRLTRRQEAECLKMATKKLAGLPAQVTEQ